MRCIVSVALPLLALLLCAAVAAAAPDAVQFDALFGGGAAANSIRLAKPQQQHQQHTPFAPAAAAATCTTCNDALCAALLFSAVQQLSPLPPTFAASTPIANWGHGVGCDGDGKTVAVDLVVASPPSGGGGDFFASGTLRLHLLPASFPLAQFRAIGLHNVSVDFLQLPGSVGAVGGAATAPLRLFHLHRIAHLWTQNRPTSLRDSAAVSLPSPPRPNVIDLRALPVSVLPSFNISATDLSATAISMQFVTQAVINFNFSHCGLRGVFDSSIMPYDPLDSLDLRGNELSYVVIPSMFPASVTQGILHKDAFTQLIPTWTAAPSSIAEQRFYCRTYVAPDNGENVLDLLRVTKANFKHALHDSVRMLVREERKQQQQSDAPRPRTRVCEYVVSNRFVDVVAGPNQAPEDKWVQGYWRNSNVFAYAPELEGCAPAFNTTLFLRQDAAYVPTLSWIREEFVVTQRDPATGAVVAVNRTRLPDITYGQCVDFYGVGFGVYFSSTFPSAPGASNGRIFLDMVVYGQYGHVLMRLFDPAANVFKQCLVEWPFVSVVGDPSGNVWNPSFFLDQLADCLPPVVPAPDSTPQQPKYVPAKLPFKAILQPPQSGGHVLVFYDQDDNAVQLTQFMQAPVFNGTYCSLNTTTGVQLSMQINTTFVNFSIVHAGAARAANNRDRHCVCPYVATYTSPPWQATRPFRPFGAWSWEQIIECIAAECDFPAARAWSNAGAAQRSGVYQPDASVVAGAIFVSAHAQPNVNPFDPNSFTNFSADSLWFDFEQCSRPVSENIYMCSSSADLGHSRVVFAVNGRDNARASMLYLRGGSEYTTLFECGRSLLPSDASRTGAAGGDDANVNLTEELLRDGPSIWTVSRPTTATTTRGDGAGGINNGTDGGAKPYELRSFSELYKAMQQCFPAASNVARLYPPFLSASLAIDPASSSSSTALPPSNSGSVPPHASLQVVDSNGNVFTLTTKACQDGLIPDAALTVFAVAPAAWDDATCPRIDLAASASHGIAVVAPPASAAPAPTRSASSSSAVHTWREAGGASPRGATPDPFYRNVVWKPASPASVQAFLAADGAASAYMNRYERKSSNIAASGGVTSTAVFVDTSITASSELSAGTEENGRCFPLTKLFRAGDRLLQFDNLSGAALGGAASALMSSCFPTCFSESRACLQTAPLLLEIAMCYARHGLSPARMPVPPQFREFFINALLMGNVSSSSSSSAAGMIPPEACIDDDDLGNTSSSSGVGVGTAANSVRSAAQLSAVLALIQSFNSSLGRPAPQVQIVCDERGRAQIVTCEEQDGGAGDASALPPPLNVLGPYFKQSDWVSRWTTMGGSLHVLCTPCFSVLGINSFPVPLATIFFGALINMMLIIVSNRLIAPLVVPRMIRLRHALAAKFAGETEDAARKLRGGALRAMRNAMSRRQRQLDWALQQFDVKWVSADEVEKLLDRFTRLIEKAAVRQQAVDFTETAAETMHRHSAAAVVAAAARSGFVPAGPSANANASFGHGAHHQAVTSPSALYQPIDSNGAAVSTFALSTAASTNMSGFRHGGGGAATAAAAVPITETPLLSDNYATTDDDDNGGGLSGYYGATSDSASAAASPTTKSGGLRLSSYDVVTSESDNDRATASAGAAAAAASSASPPGAAAVGGAPSLPIGAAGVNERLRSATREAFKVVVRERLMLGSRLPAYGDEPISHGSIRRFVRLFQACFDECAARMTASNDTFRGATGQNFTIFNDDEEGIDEEDDAVGAAGIDPFGENSVGGGGAAAETAVWQGDGNGSARGGATRQSAQSQTQTHQQQPSQFLSAKQHDNPVAESGLSGVMLAQNSEEIDDKLDRAAQRRAAYEQQQQRARVIVRGASNLAASRGINTAATSNAARINGDDESGGDDDDRRLVPRQQQQQHLSPRASSTAGGGGAADNQRHDDDDEEDDNNGNSRRPSAAGRASAASRGGGGAGATDGSESVAAWTVGNTTARMLPRGSNSAREWSSARPSFRVAIEEGIAALERDSSLKWTAYRLQQHFLATSLLRPPSLLIAAQLLAVVVYFITCAVNSVSEWNATYFQESEDRHTPLNLYQLMYFAFLNSTWPSALLINRVFFVVFSTDTSATIDSAGGVRSGGGDGSGLGGNKSIGALQALEGLTGNNFKRANTNDGDDAASVATKGTGGASASGGGGGGGASSASAVAAAAVGMSAPSSRGTRVTVATFLSIVFSALFKDPFFTIPMMLILPAFLSHCVAGIVVFIPVFALLFLGQLLVVWLVRSLPEVEFRGGQPILTRGAGLKAFLGLLFSRSFTFFAACVMLRTSFTYAMTYSALWGGVPGGPGRGWAETILFEIRAQSLDCSFFSMQESAMNGFAHIGSLFA